MGKHNKPRPRGRSGRIAVAAAAASVIAGWAAPAAYADEGTDSNTKPNPVSDAAGAVQKAAETFGKSLSGAAGAITRGAGAGSINRVTAGLVPKSPFTKVRAQTNTTNSDSPKSALSVPGGGTPDLSLPDVGTPDVGLPNLGTPDLALADLGTPDLALPDLGTPDLALPGLGLPDLGLPDLIGIGPLAPGVNAGLPPSFGFQGGEAAPLSSLSNGNNLFGLNFFVIGDRNVFTANNVGTGLQAVFAGDDNWFSGNQIVAPTSFGTHFAVLGSGNGSPVPVDVGTLLENLLSLNLTGSTLPTLLALNGSGNNIVAGLFSYGNDTALIGDGNQGSGNNGVVGAFNIGNNIARVGNDSDFSGNNGVTGFGSFASNMVFIGNGSTFSGNNTNAGLLTFFGTAMNTGYIGNDSDFSGNNFGLFNFVLIGDGIDGAGNNEGLFNVAIFPGSGQGNCTGPACFNFFGTQFGN
jgi:hypothetical protein